MAVTNQILDQRKEADCIAITPERKYYRTGSIFVKRSLRPAEWQVSPFLGTTHVPRLPRERLLNEVATLQFIGQHSAIPVPRFLGCFEDSDAVYLIMEYVDGVGMESPNDDQRAVVTLELQEHLQTLAQLRSSRLGGPSGLVVPPHRVLNKIYRDDRKLCPGADNEFGFCHNDLSQHNVIVDPETLKIRAILDWEYAGFYPAYFEGHFYRRIGPSVALANETDDTQQLVDFLQRQVSP